MSKVNKTRAKRGGVVSWRLDVKKMSADFSWKFIFCLKSRSWTRSTPLFLEIIPLKDTMEDLGTFDSRRIRLSLSKTVLNAGDQNEELECFGYKRNIYKSVLAHFLSLISLGIPYLIGYWKPEWEINWYRSHCPLVQADTVLLKEKNSEGKIDYFLNIFIKFRQNNACFLKRWNWNIWRIRSCSSANHKSKCFSWFYCSICSPFRWWRFGQWLFQFGLCWVILKNTTTFGMIFLREIENLPNNLFYLFILVNFRIMTTECLYGVQSDIHWDILNTIMSDMFGILEKRPIPDYLVWTKIPHWIYLIQFWRKDWLRICSLYDKFCMD